MVTGSQTGDAAGSQTGGAAGHLSLRSVLPLLVTGTLGRLPMVALPIASLLLVADRTNLTRGGLASGAVSLGAGGIGVLIGRRLDGSQAKRVLLLLAFLHAPMIACFVAVAGSSNPVLLAVASFAAGATVPPVGPVVRALLAQRAGAADAQRVFTWDSMSVELTWIGGPLLMSAAIILGGPVFAVALSPVFAGVGVAAIVRQPDREAAPHESGSTWITSEVVRLLIGFGFSGAGFRIITIAVTEVARLQGREEWSGALLAFWAFGSLVGAWVVTRRGMPPLVPLGTVLAVSVAAIGLGTSSIAATAVLTFLSGLPTAAFVAGLNTRMSEAAVPSAHARAFAGVQAAHTVMAAIGAAIGGAVIDQFGPGSVAVPAGLLLLVTARLAVTRSSSPVAVRPMVP